MHRQERPKFGKEFNSVCLWAILLLLLVQLEFQIDDESQSKLPYRRQQPHK
jgi:hypothetical protein